MCLVGWWPELRQVRSLPPHPNPAHEPRIMSWCFLYRDHRVDEDWGEQIAEVFERAGPVAGGLNVHAPILAPNRGVHLPVVCLEQAIEISGAIAGKARPSAPTPCE
jgi:hypothetical protein